MNQRASIGGRIKAARDMRGWSASKLAREVGVSQAAMSLYELGRIDKNGKHVDVIPGAMVMHKLCLALNVAVRWVLTGEPPIERAVYIDNDEAAFLRVYRSLPQQAREQLLDDAHKYHRMLSSGPSAVNPAPHLMPDGRRNDKE